MRRSGGRVLERVDAAAERRQLLAELVVHLARDAPPLVLLGEDEAGEELRARPLGFRLTALGEVEVRADDAHDRSAGFAPDRVAAREDLDVVAVLVAEPELALVGARAARDAVVDLLRPWHVVGVEQPFPRADVRFDLVVGVAEHLFPARRVHDVAGDEVPVPDAFLGAGKRQRQPLFAFAQRRVGALALGDLAQRPDDGGSARRGPTEVEVIDARDGDLDVGDAAVGPDDLFLERGRGGSGHQTLEAEAVRPASVGVEDRGNRSADELGRIGDAAQAAGRRVGEHEPVVLADEDAVGRQFHQAAKGFIGHAPLRMDHGGDVVTGKIRHDVQCSCRADRHV